jgi:hypothetical protein
LQKKASDLRRINNNDKTGENWNAKRAERRVGAAILAGGATGLIGIIAINRSDSNVFSSRNQDRFENSRRPLALDAPFGVK